VSDKIDLKKQCSTKQQQTKTKTQAKKTNTKTIKKTDDHI
jgi:hypothetical protein